MNITFEIPDDPAAPRCPERAGPLGVLGCERQEGHTVPADGGVLGELTAGDFHLSHDLAGRVWLWPVSGTEVPA